MSGAWRSDPGLTRVLVVGWLVAVGAGLSVELVHAHSHADSVETLVALLSLSYEQNVPTWYSSSLLLGGALAAAAIAAPAWRARDRWRWHWWGLAVGFGLMSLDEAVELHENLAHLYSGSGLLFFGWVVPAAAIVAVIGLAYLGFLRALPAASRRDFVVAGAIYLTGALLMELPLGYWTERAGSYNLTYALIDLVEESLELAGVSLFIVAARTHVRRTEEPA